VAAVGGDAQTSLMRIVSVCLSIFSHPVELHYIGAGHDVDKILQAVWAGEQHIRSYYQIQNVWQGNDIDITNVHDIGQP
jgi:hypothetical protein